MHLFRWLCKNSSGVKTQQSKNSTVIQNSTEKNE